MPIIPTVIDVRRTSILRLKVAAENLTEVDLGRVVSHPLAVTAVAFAILVVRNPGSLVAAQFVREDEPIFFNGRGLLDSYAGYLDVIPRLIAAASHLLPRDLAPALTSGLTILATALLAGFLSSDRMARAIPDRRLRFALAIGLVLLPAAQELSWHLTDIQWTVELFLVARAFATPGGWLDGVTVLLASLTGPFSILLSPLYVARGPSRTATLVVVAALIQVASLASNARVVGSLRDPADNRSGLVCARRYRTDHWDVVHAGARCRGTPRPAGGGRRAGDCGSLDHRVAYDSQSRCNRGRLRGGGDTDGRRPWRH